MLILFFGNTATIFVVFYTSGELFYFHFDMSS